MSIRQTFLIVVIASAPSLAVAQDDGKWTLRQCIDYALENNIDVKTGKLSLETAREQVTATQGQLLPSLSFSTSQSLGWRPWSQNTVALSGGTMTTTQSDVSYSGNYNLSAGWTVWDGGRTRRNLESNRLDEQRQAATNEQTANTIEEQIVQYYVQILYQADAARVADSTLAASRLLRDRGVEMLAAGQITRVDLAQLEAQASQDEYNLVSAQTQLATYKMQLKQILEIMQTQDFDVATPDIDDSRVLAPLPAVDDVYASALATRPEVKASQISISQAEIQERIARSGHYPSVSLSAGIMTGHNSASTDGVGSQIKQNVNNSLGLNISIPILDNRQTRTDRAKARIQKQQSELDLLSTQKDIYRQVETYWLAALSAQTQYTSALANEASLRASYALLAEQFSEGLTNIAELTTGKSNLLTAQQQLLQAKYTALLNQALLRFYAGEEITL